MTEISGYFEAIKDRYALTSDYTLAEKLGIAQPDANLMRRGLKAVSYTHLTLPTKLEV